MSTVPPRPVVRKCRHDRHQRGATLVEVTITLVIVSILLAISSVAYGRSHLTVTNLAMAGTTRQVVTALTDFDREHAVSAYADGACCVDPLATGPDWTASNHAVPGVGLVDAAGSPLLARFPESPYRGTTFTIRRGTAASGTWPGLVLVSRVAGTARPVLRVQGFGRASDGSVRPLVRVTIGAVSPPVPDCGYDHHAPCPGFE